MKLETLTDPCKSRICDRAVTRITCRASKAVRNSAGIDRQRISRREANRNSSEGLLVVVRVLQSELSSEERAKSRNGSKIGLVPTTRSTNRHASTRLTAAIRFPLMIVFNRPLRNYAATYALSSWLPFEPWVSFLVYPSSSSFCVCSFLFAFSSGSFVNFCHSFLVGILFYIVGCEKYSLFFNSLINV